MISNVTCHLRGGSEAPGVWDTLWFWIFGGLASRPKNLIVFFGTTVYWKPTLLFVNYKKMVDWDIGPLRNKLGASTHRLQVKLEIPSRFMCLFNRLDGKIDSQVSWVIHQKTIQWCRRRLHLSRLYTCFDLFTRRGRASICRELFLLQQVYWKR